jgi:hypothetical protein
MDFHKALFGALIMSMAQSAMVGLGKLVNPVTGKTGVDLESAQQSIDILDMLEAKTRGNLDDAEARMLRATLADLKLNYVETANAAPAAPPAPAAAEPPKPESAPAAPEEPKPDPDSKVRYRKTFE